MSGTEEVPASELEARRARLKALKEKATAKGFTMNQPSPAKTAFPKPGGEAGEAAFGGDRTKYFASFLLSSLRAKPDNETDPKMVPGTAFTEYGLTKLLDGLRERSELMGAQGKGLMKRFYDFLTAPAAAGQQMASGVNLEHLERFVNFLTKMQNAGWEGVKKDFMSGDGKDLLAAFSKPRIEVLESEIQALKQEVARLASEVAALKRR